MEKMSLSGTQRLLGYASLFLSTFFLTVFLINALWAIILIFSSVYFKGISLYKLSYLPLSFRATLFAAIFPLYLAGHYQSKSILSGAIVGLLCGWLFVELHISDLQPANAFGAFGTTWLLLLLVITGFIIIWAFNSFFTNLRAKHDANNEKDLKFLQTIKTICFYARISSIGLVALYVLGNILLS